MLQYIINSSCIWLLGLIVFDLFLRNEANHSYNRLYLLFILIAGALVPLWAWDYDAFIYANEASRPIVEQTTIVKETIVTASEQTVIGWEQWLMIGYFTGVTLLSILFLKDIVAIILLYKAGNKSKDGTWTIIETGKGQSPFSSFRYVFISNKQNYSDDELQMILAHEEQHGRLLHFIDVLTVRIGKIIFWFNPLVYLIPQRLLLIHEYQADLAVRNNRKTYRQFLVEQSVLGSAPILAHSFIHSPLKKRIIMMTKKTTKLAKSKQVLIIPVMLLSMLCFTQNALSWGAPEIDGNKITYRGNVIIYPPNGVSDTTFTIEKPSGKKTMHVTRRISTPSTLNGEKVYHYEELTSSRSYGRYSSQPGLTAHGIRLYLLKNLKREIRQLPDGAYRILLSDLIVNRDGKLVFFELNGVYKLIKGADKKGAMKHIDDKIQERFNKKIAGLLNSIKPSSPAAHDGENVPCIIDDGAFDKVIFIANKKIEANPHENELFFRKS